MENVSSKTLSLVYCGIFVALIAVCSWISIPTAIPFTLQTFAVCLASALLGTKRGTITVIVYILLGLVGVPVFSGFKSGPAALLGVTGGYIIGFIFTAIIVGLITEKLGKIIPIFTFAARRKNGDKLFNLDMDPTLPLAMILGIAVCYAFGTAWFINVYTNTKEPIGVIATLSMCVFPYLIPDICKIILAVILTKRLKKYIK